MKIKAAVAAFLLIGATACEKDSPVIEEVATPERQVLSKLDKPGEISVPDLATPVIEGKFTPPNGKLLLFVGQDSETLSDYVASMKEDHVEGITLYTRIVSNEVGNDFFNSLAGFYGPADWGAGIVDYKKSLEESPEAALAIGLYISDSSNPAETRCQSRHTKTIVTGAYDETIINMIEYLKALSPRKVFLRIGYEFDGPWNCYRPEAYKAAFRYIHGKLRDLKADNVVTVWQSAVWPAHNEDNPAEQVYDHRRDDIFELWYPGDDVVDWMGMSVFYRDLTQWNYVPLYTPAAAQEKMLAFARKHQKPIMIAEAAPQGYSTSELTHSFTQLNNPVKITAEQLWDGWYAPFFSFVYQNRDVIRSVAYINAKWESQNMWRCDPSEVPKRDTCESGNWGDSRVQANEEIKSRWLKEINNEAIWIQTSLY